MAAIGVVTRAETEHCGSRFPTLTFTALVRALEYDDLEFVHDNLVLSGKLCMASRQVAKLMKKLCSVEMMQLVFDFKSNPQAIAPWCGELQCFQCFSTLIDLIDPNTLNWYSMLPLFIFHDSPEFVTAFFAAGGNRQGHWTFFWFDRAKTIPCGDLVTVAECYPNGVFHHWLLQWNNKVRQQWHLLQTCVSWTPILLLQDVLVFE